MTGPEPRTGAQRKADTLAKLTAPAADAWVATAGDRAHLVPLSIAWIDERIVIAVEAAVGHRPQRAVRELVHLGPRQRAGKWLI